MEGLVKFGTKSTGFTKGEYGPFKCARCVFSYKFGTVHICTNPVVHEDPDVPEDKYGNKLIDGDDCCNKWFPSKETK